MQKKQQHPKHVVVSDAHHAELKRLAAEHDEKLRKVVHRVVRRGLALEDLGDLNNKE
jgi:hypothetical protein